jgi:hypothetical protein
LVPVFNPGGLGNASGSWYEDLCPLFGPADDVLLSEAWTYASALLYCFESAYEELEGELDDLTFPTKADLQAITELGKEPRDLSLEGRSWWEMIAELARQAGCRVRYVVTGNRSSPEYELQVYPIGGGEEKTLLLQAPGEKLDPAKSNTRRLDLSLDASGIVTVPVVYGGQAEIEGTWPLVHGWPVELFDDALDTEDEEYKARYVRGPDQKIEYEQVGRLWVLNEAGQASGEIFGSQELFNLTTAVETHVWARRPRTFERPLSVDDLGERLKILPEISWDDGETWNDFLGGVEVLPDAAGLLITEGDLDAIEDPDTGMTFWEALCETPSTLKMRVTATLVADDRICSRPEIPTGCPVDRPVETLYDRRAGLRNQIRLAAGTYRSQFGVKGYASVARLDLEEADDLAKQIQKITALLAVSGSASVRDVLGEDYQLGDVVTELEGRDISFAAHGQMTTAHYPEIVAITRTFGQSYAVELVLEDARRAVADVGEL